MRQCRQIELSSRHYYSLSVIPAISEHAVLKIAVGTQASRERNGYRAIAGLIRSVSSVESRLCICSEKNDASTLTSSRSLTCWLVAWIARARKAVVSARVLKTRRSWRWAVVAAAVLEVSQCGRATRRHFAFALSTTANPTTPRHSTLNLASSVTQNSASPPQKSDQYGIFTRLHSQQQPYSRISSIRGSASSDPSLSLGRSRRLAPSVVG